MHEAIHAAFIDCKDQGVHVEQVVQGRGRIVAQRCSVLPAAGIVSASDWPEAKIVACIDSVRQVKGKPPKLEQRDY
ncbi:MAG: hypothetical protein WBI41_04415, partial [Azovibrio sp.]|uniref:hypothetical protein n=1 Tax=Azovibrio sp. TaxID=1872673 RepID=UPI003C745A11